MNILYFAVVMLLTAVLSGGLGLLLFSRRAAAVAGAASGLCFVIAIFLLVLAAVGVAIPHA